MRYHENRAAGAVLPRDDQRRQGMERMITLKVKGKQRQSWLIRYTDLSGAA